MAHSIDKALITCPECRHIQEIEIPQNSCLPFYTCKKCKKTISAPGNSCCVICAYSGKKCPVSHEAGKNSIRS
ncbi:MAG: GDCCVxC domain-containing (seleno)protein [bacterium]